MIKKLVLLIVFVLCFSVPAYSKTVYVDETGLDDTDCGDTPDAANTVHTSGASHPCATLSYALAKSGANTPIVDMGDTVSIGDTDTITETTIPTLQKSNVTITSPGRATITASGITAALKVENVLVIRGEAPNQFYAYESNVLISNLTFNGADIADGTAITINNISPGDLSYGLDSYGTFLKSTIKNCTINSGKQYGVLLTATNPTTEKTNVDIEGCTLANYATSADNNACVIQSTDGTVSVFDSKITVIHGVNLVYVSVGLFLNATAGTINAYRNYFQSTNNTTTAFSQAQGIAGSVGNINAKWNYFNITPNGTHSAVGIAPTDTKLIAEANIFNGTTKTATVGIFFMDTNTAAAKKSYVYFNTFNNVRNAISFFSEDNHNSLVYARNNIFNDCNYGFVYAGSASNLPSVANISHNLWNTAASTISNSADFRDVEDDDPTNLLSTDPLLYASGSPTTGLWCKQDSPVWTKGAPISTLIADGTLTADQEYFGRLLSRTSVFNSTLASQYVNTIDINSSDVGVVGMGAYGKQMKFYVANSGSDSASGTSLMPIATLAKIDGSTAGYIPLQPGDTIYLNKGDTWSEQLTVPTSGASGTGNVITYTSYGSATEKPVISGATQKATTWMDRSGDVAAHVYSMAITPAVNTYLDPAAKELTFVYFPNATNKWGTRVANVGAVDGDMKYFYDASDDTLYIYCATGNPYTIWGTAEIQTRKFGIYALNKDYITIDGLDVRGASEANIDFTYDGSATSASDITVTNCDVGYGGNVYTDSGQGGNGVQVNNNKTDLIATNVNITNNTVTEIHDMGISIEGTGPYSTVAVTDNTISKCGGCGLQLTDANGATAVTRDGFTWSRNTISYISPADTWQGVATAASGDGAAGINVYSGTNITRTNFEVSYNDLSYTNKASGDGQRAAIRISPKSNATAANQNTTIKYNRIHDVREAGIRFHGDAAAGKSTATVCGNLIYNAPKSGISIKHILVGDIYNNTVYNCGTGATTGSLFRVDGVAATLTVKNNIFYYPAANYAVHISDATPTITHTNNLYLNASGNCIYSGTNNYTSAQAKTYEASAQNTDPKFQNATASQFWPKVGSPCNSAGTDTPVCENLLRKDSTFGAGGTVKTILAPQNHIAIGAYMGAKKSLFPVLPIFMQKWD